MSHDEEEVMAFTPRPLHEHLERAAGALALVFRAEQVPNPLPASHWFDFDSTLRLCLVKIQLPTGTLQVVLVATAGPPLVKLYNAVARYQGNGLAKRRFDSLALGCAEVLTGIEMRRWRSQGETTEGCPVWAAPTLLQ